MIANDIPVLLIVFNRIKCLEPVLAVLRKIQPRQIFVASDGPRLGVPGEDGRVNSVREFVQYQIDWDCSVSYLFQDKNLGCGLGPATAISWFFSNVEEGIILEDDCVPAESFFSYCGNLLEKYRYTNEVMHIAGNNPLGITRNGNASYYFAAIQHCWGWATWRRAWKEFNYKIEDFEEVIKESPYFRNIGVREYWKGAFQSIIDGRNDVWDFQWTFAVLKRGGKCINPAKNLIMNIGFEDGTHFNTNDRPLDQKYEILEIKHPRSTKIDMRAVRKIDAKVFEIETNRCRFVFRKAKRLVRKIAKKGLVALHII